MGMAAARYDIPPIRCPRKNCGRQLKVVPNHKESRGYGECPKHGWVEPK
jgi:hypothetical protein